MKNFHKILYISVKIGKVTFYYLSKIVLNGVNRKSLYMCPLVSPILSDITIAESGEHT